SPSFAVALQKHNAQYSPITVHHFTKSHDRFLIIDDDVYHIGASIKDLGKKWFAFCKMQMTAKEILQRL
ncbi:MAG: ORF6N domain-containing protein, partial [Paludibacteraceae bacterium]|nr:ORF6N domain-containing protein [Paludibacteraceae bacterium]